MDRASARRAPRWLRCSFRLAASVADPAQETTRREPTAAAGSASTATSEEPIEISAENGIEWKRDARTYTARGNALAQQGDTSIAADTLIAYLDDQDEISNWEAIGNVKIQTESIHLRTAIARTIQESTRLLVLTGGI